MSSSVAAVSRRLTRCIRMSRLQVESLEGKLEAIEVIRVTALLLALTLLPGLQAAQ